MQTTKEVLDTIPSKIKIYLDSVVKEKRATPRSWLYEQISTEQIVSLWTGRISSLTKEFVELIHYENSYLEKMGPQGGHASWDDLTDIAYRGFRDLKPVPVFSSAEWQQAKELTIKAIVTAGIPKNSLRPRSVDKVVDDMSARDTLSSNSGYPDFGRRNDRDILRNAMQAAVNGEWKKYPAIPLWRTYNGKTRLVWMYPMSTNIHEAQFVQPMQEALMKKSLRFLRPWKGYEEVKRELSDIFSSGKRIATSDFAHTDETFTEFHSREVFDVLKAFFNVAYHSALEESMVWINHIPMLSPDGLVTGDHGVSSGSTWTNFIETIFDWILSYYLKIKGLVEEPLMAIGDDMAHIVHPNAWDVFAESLEEVGKSIGLEINASKTRAEIDNNVFLQRIMIKGVRARTSPTLGGIYRLMKALNSSIYPEKFHNPKNWSSDMFCIRQYMILENLVDHPLFEEFVKWTVHGQKDLLPFARRNDDELKKVTAQSRKLPGLNPTYNQEKRDKPLSEYESIKFARSL